MSGARLKYKLIAVALVSSCGSILSINAAPKVKTSKPVSSKPKQRKATSGPTKATVPKSPAPKPSAPKQPAEFVALEPEKAGPDFNVQGEYVGELTTAAGPQKMAAQVVAIGAHAFRAYLLQGGLPGDGWDGTSKIIIQGRTDGDKTPLIGAKGYSAAVEGENLSGQNDKGEKFTLKKVLRESPTQGAASPPGAKVLYDGTDTSAWQQARVDERKLLAAMVNPNVLRVGPGPTTKQNFKDFSLHVEFLIPFKPFGRGQNRGNSGILLQNRYELQILDTFGSGLGIKTAEGDVCGDIFGKGAALVNMCYPPLSWQTYDIDFEAARYDGTGKKIRHANATIKLNGVLIQDRQEINGTTHMQQPEGPQGGPVVLQDHGSPVFFRHIWIVEK